MRDISYDASHALLLLGRLDGRLATSTVADIWLARARLQGATTLARAAGVPIDTRDLQNWIAGRTVPPRHSEGLNDPLSIAALFHFALSATEDSDDPLSRATINLSRSLLDDREEAALWGGDDLVRFGPVWREAGEALGAPYPSPSFMGIAERLIAVRRKVRLPLGDGILLTTADGRQWRMEVGRSELGWLAACYLPLALQRSGLALRILPSFTDIPRLISGDAEDLAQVLQGNVVKQALEGLRDLDRIERQMARLPADFKVTRRSRAPLLMRLELAYPGLSRVAVAQLLGISHQGATKLVAQVRALGVG